MERIRSEVARITRVRGRGHLTVPPSGDEIARLAETMNLMLDRFEQADATTRRFVSDASHELRSPLATIIAAIDVANRATTPDPARDEVIASEALRMQRLVDDLLTLAKADETGSPSRCGRSMSTTWWTSRCGALRATVEFPVTASIAAARVTGDPARLSQAIRNLVDNAARHTTGGVDPGASGGRRRRRAWSRWTTTVPPDSRGRAGSGCSTASPGCEQAP